MAINEDNHVLSDYDGKNHLVTENNVNVLTNGDVKNTVVNDDDVKAEKEVEEEEEEEEEVLRCGYGKWKPDCLQRCNVPGVLLAACCYLTFVQSFTCSGITSVNISTLERRFHLSSWDIGWMSGAYDITAGTLSLVYGYLGTFAHNGQILTVASFFMAAGAFTFFLPYLTAGIYELGQSGSDLCDPYGNFTECDEDSSSLSNYLYVFITAQILLAIGGCSIYVISIPYMDSNIRIQNTPMYIGTMYAFGCIGPACGYILGGYFLTIYVDFARVDMDSVTVTPSDPSWVGAWWIGYVCGFFLFLISGILMFAFPKELPTARLYRAERKSQAYKGKGDQETSGEDFGRALKDLWVSLKVIFLNPVWILNTLAGVVAFGAIVSFAMFLPKLMQYQFVLTPGEAALAAAIVIIPGAAGGFLIGGAILRGFDLKMRGMVMTCIIGGLITWALSFIFVIRCNMPPMAGITVQYFDSSEELDEAQLIHECNAICNCTQAKYDPICGVDEMQYFSPCHAGCTVLDEIDDTEVYYDCSCINSTSRWLNETQTWSAEAQSGMCDIDCTKELVIYMILFFLMLLALFAGNNSGQSVSIRCIPDKERAFSIGIQSCLIRFFGNVPMPLIFGAIFDKSCLVWQENCDETGACWVYDSEQLGQAMAWATFTVAGIFTVCFILIYIVYKPPPEKNDKDKLTEEEEDLEHREKVDINSSEAAEGQTNETFEEDAENWTTRL